jgi:deoxyhypusine synthase
MPGAGFFSKGTLTAMARELHDGRKDGLKALESLDLGAVNSFADLLRAMSKTAFSGRQLGEAFEVALAMARDAGCSTVLTLSGAMTVAKQGKIICEMIDRGLVQAVVATGALMAHGLTESIGLTHYAISPDSDDTELFEKGYNRIYDTLEMESNLNDVAELVGRVLEEVPPPTDVADQPGVWSSARFCRAVGQRLDQLDLGPGILRSAYRKNVPVFVPAFTDSEMGLDFSTWAMNAMLPKAGRLDADGEPVRLDPDTVFRAIPPYNPFLDLQEYARLIGKSERIGIFTVGGGVPRNWSQQVAPYFDITAARLGIALPEPRFQYGVRICPEPVHWGGLSGCTYSEGVSWGKFVPPAQGGRYAEIYADATVVWPLLMKAVFEELDKK